MSGANSWLARQRKSDLVALAEAVGLTDYDSMRKSELEVALDQHLSEHATRYQSNPRFQDYFKSRARAGGSPVKKELAHELKVSRRRIAKAVKEVMAPEPEDEEEEEEEENSEPSPVAQATQAASTALAQTPARAMSLASRLQLPATPADVAQAVDRGTVAVRERVVSLYQESGITEATQTTRERLSTVHSVISLIALFELYKLRQEVLPDRYAFTIPALKLLHTPDYPVHLPDMFALLTASFWGPALTWLLTSVVLPSLFGYFFNLSAAHHSNSSSASSSSSKSSSRRAQYAAAVSEYAVDPLTFSIVKAVATYVVYAQGVTFGGLINPDSVSRINSALYSGWRGVLVGTAVSALTSVYDAVLSK